MGFEPGTSPTALVLGDNYSLRLFWVGSGVSYKGAWFSDFNGTKWTSQRNMGGEIEGQGFLPHTNPCTAELGLTPYVFWVGHDQDMWFSAGITFNMSSAEWWRPDQCFRVGQCFTVNFHDTDLAQYLQAHLKDTRTIGPKPSPAECSKLIARLTHNWEATGKPAFASRLAAIMEWCTTRTSEQEYQAQINIASNNSCDPPPTMPRGLYITIAFLYIGFLL